MARRAAAAILLTVMTGVLVTPAFGWRAFMGGGQSSGFLPLAVHPSGDVFLGGFDVTAGSQFWVARLAAADGGVAWRVSVPGSVSPNAVEMPIDMVVDAAGNPVVAGSLGSASIEDFAVVKLAAASGAELWRRTIDGGGLDEAAYLVALAPSGDVIAAGILGSDWGIVRLDGASGTVVWTRTLTGAAGTGGPPIALAVDASGDVAVAGILRSAPLVDDTVVTKLSGATGLDLWPPVVIESDATSLAFPGMAMAPAGDVYVAGGVPSVDGSDLLVMRLADADGSVVWSQTHAGALLQRGREAALTPDGDLIIVDGGSSEQTMLRLAGADGSIQWQVELAPAQPALFASRSVAFDADGDVVVGGEIFPTFSLRDVFVAKYDAASGSPLWTQSIAGDDPGFFEDGVRDIAVDGQGRVVASAVLSRAGMPSEPMAFTVSPRLPGERLLVRDNALDATKRKLLVKSRSADILAPGANGPGDPTLHGATLEVTNPMTAESVSYALPAAGWTTNSATNGIAKYVYRDRTLVNGPCRSVTVQTGKKLIAKCVGSQFGFTLDEPAQVVLEVRLVLGTSGFPYCLEYGPGALRDFPASGSVAGYFDVRDAPAPPTCAGD